MTVQMKIFQKKFWGEHGEYTTVTPSTDIRGTRLWLLNITLLC